MRRRGASIGEIEALYRRHLPRFLRATAAIVGDEGLASDAVQNAFASAVKARSSFRRDVALEAWLWRIVINAALQVRRGLRDEEAESEAEAFVETNGQPVEDLAVRRWVALLPERQRLAVFLRYFADLDYRSIAVALDVEVGDRLSNPFGGTRGAAPFSPGGGTVSDVEPLIASSFERIFPQPDADADWDEVLRRAGVRSHRYLVALVVVATLVLAPAAWAITHAFQGKPAPASIKSYFQESNKSRAVFAKTLGRKEPKAIVSKAHGVIQVKTADGPIDLWAAPARGGGTCAFVGWQSDLNHAHATGMGDCYRATAALAKAANNLVWGSWGDYQHRNYKIVNGYAYNGATTVRVTLSNGKTTTLPVVEHLFLGALHQSTHWRQRPKLVSITTRDGHGHIVGYWRLRSQ